MNGNNVFLGSFSKELMEMQVYAEVTTFESILQLMPGDVVVLRMRGTLEGG